MALGRVALKKVSLTDLRAAQGANLARKDALPKQPAFAPNVQVERPVVAVEVVSADIGKPRGGLGVPAISVGVPAISVGVPTVSAGAATVAAPIPANPTLVGQNFYAQWFSVANGANPFGGVTTQGSIGTIR